MQSHESAKRENSATDEIRDKMWYARYALTKAENKMNAQGVNGKLMEDAQRSSSGRGIFWRH